jgi:hypothetical protein
MATKPPARKRQPWQVAGYQTQAAYRASPDFKPPTVKAAPQGQVNFRPTQIKFGVAPKDNPNIFSKKGYRKRSRGGEKYPNAPGTPVEFNPNADLNTVQGNIDAGTIQWTPGLGKLGYTPPPRAPGDINIPGYKAPGMDIGGDWEYQAALGDINAADAADAAAARENINALAVSWGGDLSQLLGEGMIDKGAADAAKSNQFSQMAELGRQLSQGTGRAQAQLASRGILSSGALPGVEGELNRQYQQETNTGLLDLMGKVRGIRSSQAQGAAERRAGLAGVRSSVANRLAADPMYQSIPDQQAFWDPQFQAYVDDWGRRYNRQGQQIGYA